MMSYLMEVLGVIIGLIYVWLLLSVAVEQVQEWIAGWLSLRADTLQDAIWDMINDVPKERKGPFGRFWEQVQKFLIRRGADKRRAVGLEQLPAIVDKLYAHPLIKSLSQKNSKPEYIPPEIFAKALFSIVMTAGTEESVIQGELVKLENHLLQIDEAEIGNAVRRLVSLAVDDDSEAELEAAIKDFKVNYSRFVRGFHVIQEDLETTRQLLKALDADVEAERVVKEFEVLRAAVLDLRSKSGTELDDALSIFEGQFPNLFDAVLKARLPDDPEVMLRMVETGATKLILTNSKLSQLLHEIIRDAKITVTEGEQQLALARLNVETWFNDAMDRTNGWYKRNRQWGAFVIAFCFALFLNVDTVDIGTALWRDPGLREVVEQAAITKAMEGTGNGNGNASAIEEAEEILTKLNIPFGWNFRPIESYSSALNQCATFPFLDPDIPGKTDIWGYIKGDECIGFDSSLDSGFLSKVIGVVITAFAGMQGAPFWFDMLNKIVNVRAAGKKPGSEEAANP